MNNSSCLIMCSTEQQFNTKCAQNIVACIFSWTMVHDNTLSGPFSPPCGKNKPSLPQPPRPLPASLVASPASPSLPVPCLLPRPGHLPSIPQPPGPLPASWAWSPVQHPPASLAPLEGLYMVFVHSHGNNTTDNLANAWQCFLSMNCCMQTLYNVCKAFL